MKEKTGNYRVLGKHVKQILDIISRERYRDTDEFIDTAIKILLTWESKHPENTIKIMQGLMPFTAEQEAFMALTMKPEEKERYFGNRSPDSRRMELEKQRALSSSNDDHMHLKDNLSSSKTFIRKFEIKKPDNVVEYNGYPLLSSFYSRFLPVKIVISVLGNMLYERNDWRVTLTDLRVASYDIVEEFSEEITNHEKINKIARNKKLSTGLPKKGKDEVNIEKMGQAQKRFKDHFVGKVRKNRKAKKDQITGAVAALGLICVFEENGEEYVTLTEKGKDFFLLHNTVIEDGDFTKGALSKDESDFILNNLISALPLEKMLIDTAISTIKNGQSGMDEKITDILDREFVKTAAKFVKENPESAHVHNIDKIDRMKDDFKMRTITGWRVATMGRLSEMQVITWTINERGDSEFTLN